MEIIWEIEKKSVSLSPEMKQKRSIIILAILFVLIAVIRFVPGAGEVYALKLYPHISAVLSYISAFCPVSLDECVAIAGILWLIVTLVKGIKQAEKWWKILIKTGKILCLYLVWFYLGWGCNYFRNDFYHRMEIIPTQADKEIFMVFAKEYAERLNESWLLLEKEEDSMIKSMQWKEERDGWKDSITTEVKALYHHLPAKAGLCLPKDYQKPKEMLLNRLYSASGVLGFMGPWMCENLLNADLLPVQYPTVYAHELSHLLGVNNEAEANFWAYYVCTRSSRPEVRYSGYQGVLPYVLSNARMMLKEEEYREYYQTICPKIIEQQREIAVHWQGRRISFVDHLQDLLLDLQLKGNNIPTGLSNYNQVVELIISAQENTQK